MKMFANDFLNERAESHEKWKFNFGDRVQNMCVNGDSPMSDAIFVKYKGKGSDKLAQITNGLGAFWNIGHHAIEPYGWNPK